MRVAARSKGGSEEQNALQEGKKIKINKIKTIILLRREPWLLTNYIR